MTTPFEIHEERNHNSISWFVLESEPNKVPNHIELQFSANVITGLREARIVDVRVNDQSQNHGIGTEFVSLAIAESRRAGCHAITGDLVPPDNVLKLVGFYRRFGFQVSLHCNNAGEIAGKIEKKL